MRLWQTFALLHRDRKIPISALTQSTVESADRCSECEWALSIIKFSQCLRDGRKSFTISIPENRWSRRWRATSSHTSRSSSWTSPSGGNSRSIYTCDFILRFCTKSGLGTCKVAIDRVYLLLCFLYAIVHKNGWLKFAHFDTSKEAIDRVYLLLRFHFAILHKSGYSNGRC